MSPLRRAYIVRKGKGSARNAQVIRAIARAALVEPSTAALERSPMAQKLRCLPSRLIGLRQEATNIKNLPWSCANWQADR